MGDRFEKLVLEGRHVRLEPLADTHLAGLEAAIRDGELWKLFVTSVPHPDELADFLANAEAEHAHGGGLTFTSIEQATGRVAGSTRFMNSELAHRRTEIGFTFLGKSWQRTAINTEAKLLMLSHAFGSMGLNRVEFRTDVLNTASRTAILRLGAKEEGTLRRHMVMRDGRARDTVVYSITSDEWPGVQQNLVSKLEEKRSE